MLNHRSLKLFAFLFVVIISSVMCEFTQQVETLQEIEDDEGTRVAETVAAIDLTGTAGAPPTETLFPPTPTPTFAPPTPTPTAIPPTSTPDLAVLALLSLTDPAGDSAICATGATVDDPAVDILTIEVFDPAAIGSDWTGWLARVGMGAPADETFENDWSGALLMAHAPLGATGYDFIINQTHAVTLTIGVIDPASGEVEPGSEGRSYIDDEGSVWFQLPPDVGYIQIASFHLPSEDMPDDQKRCDVAPNESAYTLELP
jgi:hypothetical protein